MNTWQALKQIRRVLLDRTWEGGANKVFPVRSVIVTAGVQDEEALGKLRHPLALIKPQGSRADAQEPGLMRQTITVRLIMSVQGGANLGSRPLMGASPVATDRSPGRGLLEVEEEVLGAIQVMGKQQGVQITNTLQSGVAALKLESRGYVAVRDYEFEATLTSARFYTPARSILLTDLTGGQVRIDWKNPPDRFDRRTWMLRRVTGSTPPATTTDGSLVTQNQAFGIETVTDSPGTGTFSYSVFVTYDDLTEPPTFDRRASAGVGSTVVVT